jgi:hypothetical protein
MSESPTKLLDDRIAALISRLRALAAERDEAHREGQEMKSRLESLDRDNARLRTVLDDAVRELRQE